jgi:hypothetical protein
MRGNNFFDKLKQKYSGSYGMDRLSKYLLIAGLILYFGRSTYFIGLAIVAYATFRILSLNKQKRYQELMVFENLLSKVKQRFYNLNYKYSQSKHYKLLKCPNCSQKLRVPKKKGRIVVTCKKCGTEFKAKS